MTLQSRLPGAQLHEPKPDVGANASHNSATKQEQVAALPAN